MKKPLIIIPPQYMPMEEPFRENYNYTNCFNTRGILARGGVPVVPVIGDREDAMQVMEQAQGLFLTGGADLSPEMYGEEKIPCCGKTEPERDRTDLLLLKAALELHRPVLGVCRGSQLVNVYFGGTLYQDLPTQRPGSIRHRQHDYPDYTRPEAHQVNILENTPLAALTGAKSIGVNSLHHQAVKDLAPGMKPMAISEDGLVESFYLPDEDQWIRAYQWHPEMLEENAVSDAVLQDFVQICRENLR